MTESVGTTEPGGPLGDTALPDDRPRSVGRRIFSGFLSYGVVALAVWYLLTNLQTDDLTTAIALITAPMLVASIVLGLVNLATNWPPIIVALPGLKVREAGVTNTAGAALSNTVPEGGAVATGLNYAMLRSWGFTLGDTTSEVLVTGTWSQLMKYALLAMGLVAVVLQGWGPPWVVWVALGLTALVALAIVLLTLILRSERFARRLGARCDRLVGSLRRRVTRIPDPGLTEGLPLFRTQMVRLLRLCWGRLTVTMLVSQLTVVLVLGLCVRMQGLDRETISWAVILVAWGLVTFASLLIPTPGGLGVAEVVLVGVLGHGLPASDEAAVLAAVLLYRIATFLVPIPIGLVTYLYWRMSTSWRRPLNSRGPSATSSLDE
ncbi:MAG: YbhN family protein [Ornithinibacter sp.]